MSDAPPSGDGAPRSEASATATPVPVATDATRDAGGRLPALWLPVLVALLIRELVAWISDGSSDIALWQQFSAHSQDEGILSTYRTFTDFNHPPLMAMWGSSAEAFSRLGLARFSFIFKQLPIALDVAAVGLLAQRAGAIGVAKPVQLAWMYALNPATLLLSAYHGNTDVMLAVLMLAAAVWSSKGHAGRAGLALGFAINVKLTPIVLLPILAAFHWRQKNVKPWLGALALCALPFVVLLAVQPGPFVKQVLLYNGQMDWWGVMYFITTAMEAASQSPALKAGADFFAGLANGYSMFAKALVLGIAGLGAFLVSRKQAYDVVRACAFAVALFLVLTPGFSVQYLAWPVPLLFAVSTGIAMRFAWLAGAMLATAYAFLWTGGFPMFSHFHGYPHVAAVFGVLAWAVLARAVTVEGLSLWRAARAVPTAAAATGAR